MVLHKPLAEGRLISIPLQRQTADSPGQADFSCHLMTVLGMESERLRRSQNATAWVRVLERPAATTAAHPGTIRERQDRPGIRSRLMQS